MADVSDDTVWTIRFSPPGRHSPARVDLYGWTDAGPPVLGSEIGPLTARDRDGRLWRVPVAVVAAWTDHTPHRGRPANYEVEAVVKGEFGPAD
jgi:hypothetical protein